MVLSRLYPSISSFIFFSQHFDYKTISLEGFPKPSHEHILVTILTEDNFSVAIEVPVWKDLKTKVLLSHFTHQGVDFAQNIG